MRNVQRQREEVAPLAAGERVRIAFCIDNMNVGGTELNAVRTAERLDHSRFDLRVVCLQSEGPLMERYAALGIPVHSFPLPNLYGPRAIKQGWALRKWLQDQQIEVLHAHDAYSNVFGVLWARAAGVRTIASRRWWEGLPGRHWRLASLCGYHLSDAALANSERIGELLQVGERLAPERVAVVPNFVDEHAFVPPSADVGGRLRQELGLTERHHVVGIVANLLPVKDHESLLRAVAKLAPRWPELRLVLVGDGGERAPLQALAAELDISDRVIFAGRRGNAPNLHHLFDVSVLCSRSEGLSNSILEAMAAGRPVVATDVGASGDAVVDGETGVLVPPGSPERLAEALGTLLADPERARRLGEAGRLRARKRYTPEAALGVLEDLYLRLAGRPVGPGRAERPAGSHSPARV